MYEKKPMTTAVSLLALAALTGLVALAPAHAETLYDGTASSLVRVERVTNADGGTALVMSVRNARLVPYDLMVWHGSGSGAKSDLQARLATITTDVKTRTDAEGVDSASTVSVTVDDLTSGTAKRLASFSDPGSDGVLLGRRYFASTMPGCCDSPQLHRIRELETGRVLFSSTGPGDAGSVAWAEPPNTTIARWAAFDGNVNDDARKGKLLGVLTYGGEAGPISSVQIFAVQESQYDDLWEGLAHSAGLLWLDPKAHGGSPRSGAGEPESPFDIWTLDKLADPAKLGGFQLALMLDGKRLATIPIDRDRLVPGRAVLSPQVSLKAASP